MSILVQSFLNSATKLSTTATTATTVAQLKTLVNVLEGVSTSVMEFYVKDNATTATVLVSGTLGSYGITTATTIYSSNTISALTTGITADSHTASFLVEVGKFTYDAYGTGFVVRKDGGPIDAYMTRVLALPALSARQYVFDQIDPPEARPFTYGQALISFTLNANGTFSNVVCTYGAGGYHATGAQLTMLGTQLLGGVSPGNDIVWDYVCAAGDGVITSFTYASGTPPVGRLWTFVPANGEPSFTRAMNQPDGTQFSTEAADGFAAMWNVTTDSDSFLQGTGINELDISLIPMGTEFNIYETELGAGPDKVGKQLAKLELAQLRRQAGGVTTATFYRIRNVYNIDLLADKYTSPTSTIGTTSTLSIGRPWPPVLGMDDPANAAEPDATAWVLMDGPYGDGNGFYSGQSWRKMAPIVYAPYGRETYIYGDEKVHFDGTWRYENTAGAGFSIATGGTEGTYPWQATWTNNFTAAKITSTYVKTTNYPAVP